MLNARKTLSAGFTLIELMVSIFLLMLVMIGVNTVFSTTSSTIGAGQAQSAIVRDARAAQTVWARDFSTMYGNNAPLIIKSQQLTRFNSRRAELGDTDGNPMTTDLNGDGDVADPGETASYADYGLGSHRLDVISFFSQQSLRRQTANDGAFTANHGAREAWIWLGHVAQPDNTATNPPFFDPGVGTFATNPNNHYAQQWILGRWATLLIEPTPPSTPPTSGPPGTIGPGSQHYLYRDVSITPTSAHPQMLHPLVYNAPATQSPTVLETTRFDLAGTTIAGFSKIVSDAITATPSLNTDPTTNWWRPMMTDNRFRCTPFVPRPLTAAGMAQTVPVMAAGCTQFMVEFAGDFLTQAADGTVNGNFTTTPTDNQIDFIVTGTGANLQRQIRWYGLPRNVDTTDDSATGVVISGSATSREVVPLRDIMGAAAPFERVVPTNRANYGAATNGLDANAQYICAWAPTDTVRPKLVRIVFTLEDQGDRLPGGQTFEYVYALP